MRIDDWVHQAEPEEIDNLVAEKLFGYRWYKLLHEHVVEKYACIYHKIFPMPLKDVRHPVSISSSDYCGTGLASVIEWDGEIPFESRRRERAPMYSTSRNTLWDVLDLFEKWNFMRFPNPDRYLAEVYVHQPGKPQGVRLCYASGDREDQTLNHAVIIAALHASGVGPIDTASVAETG